MFLLHFGAPEGSDVPSPLRYLIGDETYYPSGAPKWRRNILSFRCTELEKEHIILQERIRCSFST
jgi:hypothetical protein